MKKKIDAKNELEHYLYSVKQTCNDEKLKDKIPQEDKIKILDLA